MKLTDKRFWISYVCQTTHSNIKQTDNPGSDVRVACL